MANPTYVTSSGTWPAAFSATVQVTITTSGTNRALLVLVGLDVTNESQTVIQSASCTGGGSASSDGVFNIGGSSYIVRAFHIVGDGNIASGSCTVTGTCSNGNHKPWIWVAQYSGVNTATARGTNTGNNRTPSFTVTSSSGNEAVAIWVDNFDGSHTFGATAPTALENSLALNSIVTGVVFDQDGSNTTVSGSISGGATPLWGGMGYDLAPASSGATAVTMSGPSNGTINVASSNFTIGVDQTPITGTLNVTPHTDLTGTFVPSSVALTTGSPSATCTFTASVAGVHTITTTNDGALSNSNPLSYTAASAYTPYAQVQHLPMPLPLLCQ